MFGFITKIFGGGILKDIFGMMGDHFKKKRERKLVRLEAEIALEAKKQEAIMLKDTADIQWNQIMAKGSQTSWKDEYITILISLPFIAVFLPWTQEYVSLGFEVLRTQVPDWYKAAFAVVVSGAFGMNQYMKWFNNKKSNE